MVNKETLEEVKNRLVKTYDPIAIYLFGSYVWGKPTEDSDLDLLIVIDKSDEKSYERVRPGQRVLYDLNISKDLLIYTKDEFDRISNNVTTLGYKIRREGKVIYARA
jgi:uncharacterized protein